MTNTHSTTWFVPGLPATKGSTRSFVSKNGRIVTMNDCARGRSWQESVGYSAASEGVHPTHGHVCITLEFLLPRPRSHYGAKGVKAKHEHEHHTKKPDLDKLIRAVCDGLTGVAYYDDAQITQIVAAKTYSDTPGVCITVVREMERYAVELSNEG